MNRAVAPGWYGGSGQPSGKAMLCLALGAALAACKGPPPAATPAPPQASAHAFRGEIDAADFAELVGTLASDRFAGRAPGSPGEALTIGYIRDQMQRIGLQPGNGGSWFQAVPMTETIVDPHSTLLVSQGDHQRRLAFGSDMVIGSRSGQPQVHVAASEMVFVGYGVDAPEHHWNDYGDRDWRGKTVVMFINDPGFHAHDPALFDGKRMTYYGRWTYKFEEAARHGAVAALIVHDTAGAGYDWDVVNHSWGGAQYDLPPSEDERPRLRAQGWLSREAARTLFADAGLDLDKAYRDAGTPGFKPVSLQARLSLDLTSRISAKSSRNVVGVLPGSRRSDEAVVYMAHWDHLGTHTDEAGDNIYNGAVDNATGVAGILEIADAMARQPPTERSVVFLATTLEESGLLGSEYYVRHPGFPLDKIAGVINIDAMSVAGRSRDVTVTGYGSSGMEDILRTHARAQGRTLHAETAVQSGLYFRSDHFSFAKAGVPALYAGGGTDLRNGGPVAGRAASLAYARLYHGPRDEYDPGWDLDGPLEDLQLLHEVGRTLANSGDWPQWRPGNPFRARREAMMKKPATSRRIGLR